MVRGFNITGQHEKSPDIAVQACMCIGKGFCASEALAKLLFVLRQQTSQRIRMHAQELSCLAFVAAGGS